MIFNLEKPLPIFRSERGIPLIAHDPGDTGVVTAEDYVKWYDLYYIDKKWNVHKLGDLYPDFYEEVRIMDHSWNPRDVVDFCCKHELKLDRVSFSAILDMWAEYSYDCIRDDIEPTDLPSKSRLSKVLVDGAGLRLTYTEYYQSTGCWNRSIGYTEYKYEETSVETPGDADILNQWFSSTLIPFRYYDKKHGDGIEFTNDELPNEYVEINFDVNVTTDTGYNSKYTFKLYEIGMAIYGYEYYNHLILKESFLSIISRFIKRELINQNINTGYAYADVTQHVKMHDNGASIDYERQYPILPSKPYDKIPFIIKLDD